MITLRRIMIRTNLATEFFNESAGYNSALEEFKSSGKVISTQLTLSDDQLTITREITFLDDESHLFWRHNPNIVSWINQRKKYDAENGIITDLDFI